MAEKMALVIKTPLSLYRYLLRRLSVLPSEVQLYYKHRIRQEYNSYSDENDPERIQQIIGQALRDAEWVIAKYNDQNGKR